MKLEDGGFTAVKPEDNEMVSVEMEHAKAEGAPEEAAPGKHAVSAAGLCDCCTPATRSSRPTLPQSGT